jgi:hypothetical protein
MNCTNSRPAAPRGRRAAALFAACLFALSAASAEAQSGRRVPKRPDPEPAVGIIPAAPETPEEAAPAAPERPKSEIRVSHFIMDFEVPHDAARLVMHGLIERLKKSGMFEVSASSELNRKEAMEEAKAGGKPVCWVQISLDSMEDRYRARSSQYWLRLVADYNVYTPGQEKPSVYGRVYFVSSNSTYGNRASGPLGRATQYALPEEAGQQIADRVIGGYAAPTPATAPNRIP